MLVGFTSEKEPSGDFDSTCGGGGDGSTEACGGECDENLPSRRTLHNREVAPHRKSVDYYLPGKITSWSYRCTDYCIQANKYQWI